MIDSHESATLAGGCFWCLEAVFEMLEGVAGVKSGYAGGRTSNPTYEQVCSGTTGHAEVVRLEFDPNVISYRDVLEVFFAMHDPTTLNRQGNDVGTQYRSAIFFESPEQESVARRLIEELAADDVFGAPIVTVVEPLAKFWDAEAYHDEYFRNNPQNPYCAAVISPKVTKMRQKFAHRLRAVGR